ncbi:MAG TPA: lipopolysaccharide heptosyltransferase I [Thermoanaerobaculia bacterium]|nr:lipopolysaccharide heptosyltransferase I [Thermoanaerobaculia bacterium]
MTRAATAPLLVVRLSALGDVIHTMPAVVALRTALGSGVSLGWLVEEPYGELVELVAPVDRVLTVATRRWRRSPFSRATRDELADLLAELRGFARGAAAVDFQGLLKSSLFTVLSGASQRIGFDRNAIREKAALLLLNRSVAIDRALHVVEWNMQLAASLGADPNRVPWPDYGGFPADPTGVLGAMRFEEAIIVSPAAGRASKTWGIERFTGAIRALRKRQRVVVIWGGGERELAAAIAERGGAELAPPTTLRELAFVLQRARLLLAGDTGPLHLAAALRAPVVGLFGPTRPERNGPWGQLHHCVESGAPGRPMEAIAVESVVRKIEEVLGERE